MRYNNRYYEALMEGRWQPSITVAENEGQFLAYFDDYLGTRYEATSNSQADAFNQCMDLVRNGVMEGTIVPGR